MYARHGHTSPRPDTLWPLRTVSLSAKYNQSVNVYKNKVYKQSTYVCKAPTHKPTTTHLVAFADSVSERKVRKLPVWQQVVAIQGLQEVVAGQGACHLDMLSGCVHPDWHS